MRPVAAALSILLACGDSSPPPAWPDEPAPSTDATGGSNADSSALTQKLIALWRPDDPASVPPSAYAEFDAELLRSDVYVPAGSDMPTTGQGGVTSYVVYTDAASLAKADPLQPARAIPAVDVLAKARDKGYGVSVVHDGDVAVFVNLDPKEVEGLIRKTAE